MNKKKLFYFLIEDFSSYEVFFSKVIKANLKLKIKNFNYKNIKKTLTSIIDFKDKKNILNAKKIFCRNLLNLYRFLLSSKKDYEEEVELILYTMIKEIFCSNLPEILSIKNEIFWSNFFPLSTNLINQEYIEIIIKKFNEKFNNQQLKHKELIDCYLIFHLSVFELFKLQNNQTNNETLNELINNYIDLINNNPELEHIFGVTIEKDMKMIYEGLNFRNEKL